MTSNLELFYFPSSYYSQKALLTLFEKGLPFKDHIIYIHLGEQNEEWYLCMNPEGQVPVLKNGNDVISGSEEIMDYIDRVPTDGGMSLVPEVSSPLGRRVAEARRILFAAPIEEVTFGIILHPSLRAKELQLPKAMLKMVNLASYEKSQRDSIAKFERQLEGASPGLQEALTGKIEKCKFRIEHMLDEGYMRKKVESLQDTFDWIESQLQQSCKESGTDIVWLCGTTFTAADVVMAVFMTRLKWVGQDDECYSASKRPLASAYYNRLMARPSVKSLLEVSSIDRSMNMLKIRVITKMVKKVSKIALVLGAVAAVAYGVRRYIL